MMCWLAGIPLRLAHCRENPYELLTDRVPESEPESHVRHEVARQLALVRAIGATTSNWRMAFEPGDAARRAVSERLQATLQRIGGPRRPGAPSGRWLVVHPGASAASRRWPAERFGEVAASVAPLFDGIAVTGSESERALVDTVCARARAVPLAGVLSLGELGALIETADLLLSNNSGPVHLAAALGTPVVDLYALTNPQHTPGGCRTGAERRRAMPQLLPQRVRSTRPSVPARGERRRCGRRRARAAARSRHARRAAVRAAMHGDGPVDAAVERDSVLARHHEELTHANRSIRSASTPPFTTVPRASCATAS